MKHALSLALVLAAGGAAAQSANFAEIDTNGDASLSGDELVAVLGTAGADAAITKYDLDADGSITVAELRPVAVAPEAGAPAAAAKPMTPDAAPAGAATGETVTDGTVMMDGTATLGDGAMPEDSAMLEQVDETKDAAAMKAADM